MTDPKDAAEKRAVEDSNEEMVEDNAGPTDAEAAEAVRESNDRQFEEEDEE